MATIATRRFLPPKVAITGFSGLEEDEDMTSVVEADRAGPEIVRALQGWQIAKERANRANRDLLQFAAGITAVLGIVAGSGGIFAVASSAATTTGTQLFPLDLLKILMGIGFALSVVLGIMLVGAFQRRHREERTMDDYLTKLISLRPDAFLPKLDT